MQKKIRKIIGIANKAFLCGDNVYNTDLDSLVNESPLLKRANKVTKMALEYKGGIDGATRGSVNESECDECERVPHGNGELGKALYHHTNCLGMEFPGKPKKIEKPPILNHSLTDFYDVLDNRELIIEIINYINK